MVYNAMLLNHIQPESKKILKNQNGFLRNQSTNSDSNYSASHQRSMCKETWSNSFVHIFLQSIWFHTKGKIVQILLAYGFPKETLTDKLMLKNKTAQKQWFAHLIVTPTSLTLSPVSQLALYIYNLPRRRTWNIDRADKRKWFYTKKKKKRGKGQEVNNILQKQWQTWITQL